MLRRYTTMFAIDIPFLFCFHLVSLSWLTIWSRCFFEKEIVMGMYDVFTFVLWSALIPKFYERLCLVWLCSLQMSEKEISNFSVFKLSAKEQSFQRYVLTNSNLFPLCSETNSEFAPESKCERGSYGAKKTELCSCHPNYSTGIRDVDVSSVYKCLRTYVLVLWVRSVCDWLRVSLWNTMT